MPGAGFPLGLGCWAALGSCSDSLVQFECTRRRCPDHWEQRRSSARDEHRRNRVQAGALKAACMAPPRQPSWHAQGADVTRAQRYTKQLLTQQPPVGHCKHNPCHIIPCKESAAPSTVFRLMCIRLSGDTADHAGTVWGASQPSRVEVTKRTGAHSGLERAEDQVHANLMQPALPSTLSGHSTRHASRVYVSPVAVRASLQATLTAQHQGPRHRGCLCHGGQNAGWTEGR